MSGFGIATILLKVKQEDVIVWRKDEYMLFTLTSKQVQLTALAGQKKTFHSFQLLI